MALNVVTWLWGTKYPNYYIRRLHYGLRCHLAPPFRFTVLQPLPEDLWLTPGCLCRMRLFDPAFQERNGIAPGDRVLQLDLDLIVTGRLESIVERSEGLIILSGANAANPCPFNGSVLLMTAGEDKDLWDDLNADVLQTIPKYEFADDQGWIHHKRPGAAVWQVGSASGIYAFKKPGWPRGDGLPGDARIVAFPGKRDPAQFEHLPWIRKYWR